MHKRVLIVDDEPNIVMSLQFLMKREGFEVSIARTGREAIEALNSTPPDLMLLDVMLPEFDGFQVCQRARARQDWRHTKIVILTARGHDAERDFGMAAGADAFVTKPFSTRDLVSQIKDMLGIAK